MEEGKILGRLHKLREEADYGVDRDYAVVEVAEELGAVERFQSAVLRALAEFGIHLRSDP